MSAAYLAPSRPISLINILESSSSKDPTPTIDLDWEPFQAHVEAFLNSIDAYTLAAKTEIAARASDHVAAVRDLKAEKEEMERRIQLEREREGEMLATLEAERHTLTDLTSSLHHLQTTLAKVREESAALEAELHAVRKEVKGEKAEKERQGRVLEEMRGKDGVELGMMEDLMGWRVEGVKEDLLLNRFTLIDPSDPEREFSILIDVSKQDYTVPNCSPPLPQLPELVAQLNADREFFAFIKRVRKAFRALVPAPQAPPSKFDDLSGPGLRTPAPKTPRPEMAPAVTKSVEDGSALEALQLAQPPRA